MDYDIDFVVTWVDANDPVWQKDFARYNNLSVNPGTELNINDNDNVNDNTDVDATAVRYRDWGLLRYWFRGIERFAPWVRYIHFITYGHLPSWLDTSNPKLKIVRHEDYIPEKYLPLFNSNPIELLLHKIPGLSEHFVYFNDDFYLTKPTEPDYFFSDGMPCDMAVAKNHHTMTDVMLGIIEHDMAIINSEYNLFTCIVKHPLVWFHPGYRGFLKLTLKALLSHQILSLLDTHAPCPYLKSTFDEVWEKYGDQLTETLSHRFRSADDVSHWTFRYWQIAKGGISPRNIHDTTKLFYQVGREIDSVLSAITGSKYSVVVLNDSNNDDHHDDTLSKVDDAFKLLLPCKSSFEKF